jgi:hypothetical protein
MGLTMFLQQRLNPQPADPVQAKIFTFMPIMFTFLLAHFPAGLVIYWTWNNTLSILQQAFIMKRQGVPFGGKQDFMPSFKKPGAASKPGEKVPANGSAKTSGKAADKASAKQSAKAPAQLAAPVADDDGPAAAEPEESSADPVAGSKPAAPKARAKKGGARARGRSRGKAR